MSWRRTDDQIMSGATLHDGLEYQALVTALAAIELVIVAGYADVLQIEPASDDDIEGDINRPLADDEPTPGFSESDASTSAESYRLVIQVKRRDHGVWSAPAIAALLRHGKRRDSADKRLRAEPDVRYLLVTSGAAVQNAASLRVEAFGEWPDLSRVEHRFQPYAAGDQCRVGVLADLTDQTARGNLDRLLRTNLLVAHDRVDDCIEVLVREAHRRGLSRQSNLWTARDIQASLAKFDAVLPGQIDARAYVEPLNYDVMRETLQSHHALLIIGPSGTGKTRTALRLRDELLATLKGAASEFVRRTDGPQQISRAIDRAPVVIYVEDPWGPVSLMDGAAGWTKAFRDEMSHRHPGVWLIATSRSDVLVGVQNLRPHLDPWIVELTATDYGSAQRAEILQAGMLELPLALRLDVEPFRDRAVQTLKTPLEIRNYIVALAKGPNPGEDRQDFLLRALRDAHVQRFQDLVAEQVTDRDDGYAATALWLLLKGQDSLTRDEMMRSRRVMARQPGARPASLEGLADFLRAGQSLDQVDDRYSYAHPQVEAGLAVASKADPTTFDAAAIALLEGLAAEPAASPVGPMLAARILARIASDDPALASDLIGQISAKGQAAIDAKILDALATLNGAGFRDAVVVAEKIGSVGVLAFDVARWLTLPEEVPDDPDLSQLLGSWKPTAPPTSWAIDLAADPIASRTVRNFVSHVAAHEQHFYPDDLGAQLAVLGLDLEPEFSSVAEKMAAYGHTSNIEMVVAGAVSNLQAFEPALNAALDAADAAPTPDREGWRLKLANGVYDDEYSDHLASSEGDDLYCAGVISLAFVEEKRCRHGWPSLAAVPQARRLAWEWARSIERDSRPVDVKEVAAFASVMRGSDEEPIVWKLVADLPHIALAPLVADRLRDPGIDANTLRGLRRAQAVHDLDALIQDQARRAAAGDLVGIMNLHRDLLPDIYSGPMAQLETAQTQLLAALPAVPRALARAAATGVDELEPATGTTLAAARTVTTDDPALASRLLRLTDGRHPEFDRLYAAAIDGWTARDHSDAEAALKTAIVLGRMDLIDAAVEHPVGLIGAVAIRHLGCALSVTRLTAHPGLAGRFIREAVVDTLALHAGDEAALALLDFCGDAYAKGYRGDPHHPVARKAAIHLAALPTLSDGLRDELSKRALGFRDPEVRHALLVRLAADSADLRLRLARYLADPDKSDVKRRSVAFALTAVTPVLEPAATALITPDLVHDASSPVAPPLAHLFTLVSSEAQVFSLGERFARDDERRALLVLLARPDRPNLNDRLRALLPADHPAGVLFEPGGPQAPFTALDDLGDPQLTRDVRRILHGRFEPQKPRFPLPRHRKSQD